MAEPRKVFRIEKTAAARLDCCDEDAGSPRSHVEIMQELGALRALLAAATPRRSNGDGAPQAGETTRLTSELNLIHGAIRSGEDEHAGHHGSRVRAASMTRIAHELDAVVSGSEQATEKILGAAEEIDQMANNLSAALRGQFEQRFAEDIQDIVIKIFEACNFQDLIGQRVTKVMVTLKSIEDHILGVLEELKNPARAVRRDGAQELQGPRLEIDSGHATQSDVDVLFGG